MCVGRTDPWVWGDAFRCAGSGGSDALCLDGLLAALRRHTSFICHVRVTLSCPRAVTSYRTYGTWSLKAAGGFWKWSAQELWAGAVRRELAVAGLPLSLLRDRGAALRRFW